MPSASQTIRLRRLKQSREGQSPWLKLGLFSALLISLMAVAFSLVAIWFYVDLSRNLPQVEILPILLDPPNGMLLQPTRLFDRDHEHVLLTLENPAAEKKQYLFIAGDGQARTPLGLKYLVSATISELDPGFWDNPGYSLAGVTQGTHPTLAQILVSDLLLDGESPSLKRNIRERLLAAQITAEYSRNKVLEWYLNSAQYGETIYGADAAARIYFGKSTADLSLAEAATLTSLAEKPSINPLTGSQILAKQKEAIIQKMLAMSLISVDESLIALKEDVRFQDQVASPSLAPAFTALVLKQLSSTIPLDRIYRGGFEIQTTLDYSLQQQVDCAAQAQTARLRGKLEPTVTFDGSPCQASSLLPSLQEEVGTINKDITAEVVIIDPYNGQILVMVGEDKSGTLPSSPSAHPAGTILSPFMFLTAFSRGLSPATLLWDVPEETNPIASNPAGQDTLVGSLNTYHGPVSLREAFVNDYAAASGEVWQQVGAANVLLTEKQFGFGTIDLSTDSGPGLDNLYKQNVSLVDSVHAYSALANYGVMAGHRNNDETSRTAQRELSPSSMLKVETVNGQEWMDWTIPDLLPVVTRQIAYLTTNVLSDENARSSLLDHPNSLEIGRPVAAKLSITADGNGAWTVGYIPQLAVGVWIGNSQGKAVGITREMPAALLSAIMQYAARRMPIQEFSVPAGVSQVQVCTPSGLLVSSLCPVIVQEVFLSGNEPTQVDNLYQKYAINKETGLLATIFTPPEMVEEKVLLAVPPPAKAWAKEAGLAIPPDTYDNITATQPISASVQISYPQMFDHVGGKFEIIGSTGGELFSYYRLQVGQGLNPQKWLQIGEDIRTPVSNGLLGTWDTTGLEGLYIVQLEVIRQDSSVDQAILEITVDNTPPEVEILSPKNYEQFSNPPGKSVMLNVSATDNLAVMQVEIYIDDQLEAILLEPPYVILWDAMPGEHTLRVKASDLAGNHDEAAIAFIVGR